MKPALAILAGGAGSRLGGVRKPLLEVGGRAILDRQLEALAPRASAVAVVAPDPSPFAREGVTLLRDAAGSGPLAGLAAALAWSPSPWLFAVAGDLPFVDGAALDAIAAHTGGADLVAPRIAGRLQPLAALYRAGATRDAAAELAAGGAGPRALFAAAASRGLRATIVGEDELSDRLGDLRFAAGVNTPSELERARRLASVE